MVLSFETPALLYILIRKVYVVLGAPAGQVGIPKWLSVIDACFYGAELIFYCSMVISPPVSFFIISDKELLSHFCSEYSAFLKITSAHSSV